jgi:hypothetical protein
MFQLHLKQDSQMRMVMQIFLQGKYEILSIHIHEALEKEFNIDVKDKVTLVTDVEIAYYVVMKSHGAL